MKKILCSVLCLVMTVSLFGCKNAVFNKEVNARDMMEQLVRTDKELGIKGKYEKIKDIKDASVDGDVVGKWILASGEATYNFTEKGKLKAKMKDYGSQESKFTCFEADGVKVLCIETTDEEEDEDGKKTEEIGLDFMTYTIENGVLYMMSVEDTTDKERTSAYSQLIRIFRADDKETGKKSVAKNKLTVDSFDGKWTSDDGKFTIEDGKLTLDKKEYDLSFNDKNELVVSDGKKENSYSVSITLRKEFDEKDHSKVEEKYQMGIYYTGKNAKDKPNLKSVLTDWHSEYQSEDFYYSGTFETDKK